MRCRFYRNGMDWFKDVSLDNDLSMRQAMFSFAHSLIRWNVAYGYDSDGIAYTVYFFDLHVIYDLLVLAIKETSIDAAFAVSSFFLGQGLWMSEVIPKFKHIDDKFQFERLLQYESSLKLLPVKDDKQFWKTATSSQFELAVYKVIYGQFNKLLVSVKENGGEKAIKKYTKIREEGLCSHDFNFARAAAGRDDLFDERMSVKMVDHSKRPLRNITGTCFFNILIQMLFYYLPFQHSFMSFNANTIEKKDDKLLFMELQRLFELMLTAGNQYI